jgi:hypothetical protein
MHEHVGLTVIALNEAVALFLAQLTIVPLIIAA